MCIGGSLAGQGSFTGKGGIFQEIQKILYKRIAHKFRAEAEDKFVDYFKNSELNEQLDQQEYCLGIKRILEKMQTDLEKAMGPSKS